MKIFFNKKGLSLTVFFFIVWLCIYSSIFFVAPKVFAEADTISIASFNLQIFGKTKANNKQVMKVVAKIMTQYDIIAIQEIRDSSGTAIKKLEKYVDDLGTNYGFIVGPRLGRTNSKEQYAYFYKTKTIKISDTPYTYNENGIDIFHREPFIASFSTINGNFDFVLIDIHVDPNDAKNEINALPNVIQDAKNKFSQEKDFIVLGDMNADCTYYDEDDLSSTIRSNDYVWLINNDEDTNIAQSSCTYDRIIMTKEGTEDFTEKSGVFKFDISYELDGKIVKKISDHYPVYAIFYVDKDSD